MVRAEHARGARDAGARAAAALARRGRRGALGQALFDELDADRSGELGEEQFRTLLLANEIELDETNFRLLVDTMDPEGDGLITRDSFAEHIAGREDARRPARFRRNGHGTPVRASSRAPEAGPPSPRFSAEV